MASKDRIKALSNWSELIHVSHVPETVRGAEKVGLQEVALLFRALPGSWGLTLAIQD